MSVDASASMRGRVALAAVAVVGLVAVMLIVATAGSSGVPGMPASVRSVVGNSPMVVTLHGDTLALISDPDVEAVAALERRLGGVVGVSAQYGPARWLTSQIASVSRSVNAHTTKKVHRSDLLVRSGVTGNLSLTDETLTSTLVFGTGTAPLARVHWLFPEASSARIFLRLGSGTSLSRLRARVLAIVNATDLPGVTATVAAG